MSRLTLFRVGFLFLILFFTTTAKAQKEAETFNVDSTLYEYYQRCQEYLLEPVVLNMSDTLFRMAGERQDERMQAVAIATQLDYYYFQGTNEDSVIHYTNKVKEFAKATHQPKYYYFAWANRLITYYLKTSRTNIALYEVQNMLKEAQEEDDKTGLSRCYNIMSQIYTIKRFDSMAFEWRLKEIELTEKYKIENYNISQTYAQIANYYINQKKQKEALAAVEKAIATANSSTQQISAKLEFVNYYSKFGDFQAAEKLLKECQAAFEQDKRLESIKKRLYNIECLYYQQTKQYPKALEAAKMQEKEERRLSESILSSSHYRTQGEIYQKMGNMNLAVKYLQMYINTDDSLKIANEHVSSSEFATLLNVEKLNAEKKELMLQAQEKELHNKTTLIISLIILLGILFIFLYRENFLKRKLKVSEAELKTKNEELTVSREELRKAKDIAEASSRMKTTFIQSMTHEIRTPLNAIVGFSDVISTTYDELSEEERADFVRLISINSEHLVRLIDDILDLSKIESNTIQFTFSNCSLKALLMDIEKEQTMKPISEIEIKASLPNEDVYINTDITRLKQVICNFINNARKFTEKGHIHFGYAIDQTNTDSVQIYVEDTGSGIPQECLNEIFDRFYKVDTFKQGTGLGLSICKTIVEHLQGEIFVESKIGKGSRFTVTLPFERKAEV